MTGFNPQPGDWVKVTAKVLELHPNDVDLGLELFSKTDQYLGFIRRDLCEPREKPTPDEPGEASVALLDVMAYQRLGDGHWYAAGSTAIEVYTWVELNRLGDVKVIHHA